MADKETGLNISVNAEANEASAAKAAKDLEKKVNNSVKGGRITVPVDITVPIDKDKNKLTRAQSKVVEKINKLTSKGFSASGEDIDDLNSKFKDFTKELDRAGKGRQNKIFKEIRKQVEILEKQYQELKTTTNSTKTYTSKTSGAKKSTNKTPKERYLDQQEARSRRAQGAGKRAELTKELDYVRRNKSPIKSSGDIKLGMTNDHELRASEYSFYGSQLARMQAQSARKAKKWERKSLRSNRYGTIEALDAETKKRQKADPEFRTSSWIYKVVDEAGKKVVKRIETTWTQLKRTTPLHELTDVEKAQGRSAALRNNLLPELLKNIRATDDIATVESLTEKFFATLKTIGEQNQKAGMSLFGDIKANLGLMLGQLGFTTKGHIGGVEKSEDKTEKSRDPKMVKLLQGLFDGVTRIEDDIKQEFIKIEQSMTPSKNTKKTNNVQNGNSLANRLINETQTKMSAQMQAVDQLGSKTDAINRSIKIGNTKAAVDNSNTEKIDKENKNISRDTAKTVKIDAGTGFNTDAKADELIGLVRNIFTILQSVLNIKRPDNLLALPKGDDLSKSLSEIYKDAIKSGLSPEQAQQKVADVSNARKGKKKQPEGPITNGPTPPKSLTGEKEPYKNQVEKSNIYASPFRQGVWRSLENAFVRLIGASKGYEKVLQANADEQDQMAAERIKTYGLNNGRNPNDTGDIAGMRRILQLYRTNKASIDQNPELMQKIKLTPGRDVDTTALTKALNKVLSGRQMQNAQNGGGFWKNVFGFASGGLGYAFMPSLEKSRALADGLNQMFANTNKALQTVLINIQTKETELAGMEASGQAQFDKDGYLTSNSSSAAFKTLADLEEEKLVLDSIKADLLANDEIIKKTGGRYSLLVKYLNFTSPVLKDNNGILRNLNSGLDKNGKALKFQTRLAEILNYTYQLMSRSIGQMVKNWLSMLNPINILKKAFSDFTSYNVKWQRTMNVIKYNLRAIGKTLMDAIAQKLVNIIGFFDIISMKIQSAFGKIPISLFDQAAADTEKMAEDLEAASNVSAGFDELHDIGSDNSGANDLLGEIYEPQLSPEWKKLAEDIGDLFGHIIKGDMGFGEVMKTIVKLLGQALSLIAKTIWDWFKNTAIGKYITSHWASILGTMLAIFLGWKLLKIAGKLLFNALFEKLTGTGVSSIFSTLGTKVGGLFGKTLYTGASGSIVTVGKLLGGLTLTAVGTAGAITTAVKAGSNWEDMSTGAKVGSQALQGVFSAAAGLGAVLLGASGPVGWGIAIATFAVAAGIGLAQTRDGIDSVKKETEKLAEAQQTAQEANDLYLQSMDNLAVTMSNLEQLEAETGLSGAELDQQVKQGILTVDQMTAAQVRVYNAYLQNEEQLKINKKVIEAKTEADKNQVLQSLRVEAANAIEAKSYDHLKEVVVNAWKEGSISAEEAGDILSRTLANADSETQRTFGESIPAEIQAAFKPEKYISGWDRFGTNFKNMMNDLGKWFSDKWTGIKNWWNSLWSNNNLPNTSGSTSVAQQNITGGKPITPYASYAVGTNYVPNDGLAYLHQGEAVIPKKYNQPYKQGLSMEEQLYMKQMMNTMRSLDDTMKQGITVNGQFTQRGSDLVAVVNKTKSQTGADLLSNVAYAR